MYIKLRRICGGCYDYSLYTPEGDVLVLTAYLLTKREAMEAAKKLAKNLGIRFRGN